MNIYPIHTITREEKQTRLGQRGKVFWFTGLSGSGKSTLALAAEQKLFEQGYHVVVLDGDNIRNGINSNLGFSEMDRKENIRRIAEVSKLFLLQRQICIVSFISPLISMRKEAQDIIGAADFLEVFIDTPLAVCESRDVKGLYKKARAGEIQDFTGIQSPYEPPVQPDIHIQTQGKEIGASLEELYFKMHTAIQW